MAVSISNSNMDCERVTYIHVFGQAIYNLIRGDMSVSVDVHAMSLMSQRFFQLPRDDFLLL